MSDMLKLSGLWRREGKDGSCYTGSLAHGVNVLIFKNKFKQNERDPDLVLYLAPAPKQEKPTDSAGGAPDEFPVF